MGQTREHTEGSVFAVHAGRKRGVFLTWRETLKQVKGFQEAVYKKHSTRQAAELWLEDKAAKDAQPSAQATGPTASASHPHLLNALALDINAPTFRDRALDPSAEAAAAVQVVHMDSEDSDDGLPSVDELEKLLRRARIRDAKKKARASVARTQDPTTTNVQKEDVQVKEETMDVDVKTWTMVKAEKDSGPQPERRYTSSEKGKWRAESSRTPAADTSTSTMNADTPKPFQRTQSASSAAEVKTETKSTPVPRLAPPVMPSSRQIEPAPPRQARPPLPPPTPPAEMETISKAAKTLTTTVTTVSSPATAAALPIVPGPPIIAYTDGSARNNQSKALRTAGYGIHWASGRPAGVSGDISCRCANGRTNNYAELLAIIRTLEYTSSDPRPLTICSDSQYSIDCFGWLDGWCRRGWKTANGQPVKNLDVIRYMVALRALRKDIAGEMTIEHVKGHSEVIGVHKTGNDAADRLATAGADLPESAAEPDTDELWAQRRATAEKRLEESKRKQKIEAVHVDVGIALGLTAAPAAVVAAATQAAGQATIVGRKQESTTKTEGGSAIRQWNRDKLSRQGILAALHAPVPGEVTSSSHSGPSTSQPTSASTQPTPVLVSQPQNPSTPVHTSILSAGGAPLTTSRTSTAPAPKTPSRMTGGPTSTQTGRAHTTPVAVGTRKQGGKAIVRIVEDDEGYDGGDWDVEDASEDADMIAEAMGR